MKFAELLNEERQKDLVYKEKQVKNVLDRVTVELSGNYSGAMSRLTTRYTRLDKQAKLMTERRNDLNAQMKDVAQRLFDAEDEVLTRVVETVSYSIMLTKAEKAATKDPKKTVDYSAIVKELGKLLPELSEQITALTEKYTEIAEAKDTPTMLKVKSKVDESIIGRAWGWVRTFAENVKSWARKYDDKLAELKKMKPIKTSIKI